MYWNELHLFSATHYRGSRARLKMSDYSFKVFPPLWTSYQGLSQDCVFGETKLYSNSILEWKEAIKVTNEGLSLETWKNMSVTVRVVGPLSAIARHMDANTITFAVNCCCWSHHGLWNRHFFRWTITHKHYPALSNPVLPAVVCSYRTFLQIYVAYGVSCSLWAWFITTILRNLELAGRQIISLKE